MSRRIAPVLAVVALFYAVLVPLRIEQHGVLWFVHVGDTFLRSAHTSPAIDSVRTAQSASGYDGQFYFMIAADPAHARDYMRAGGDGDQAGKRYARIGYPMLARAFSLGSVRALPYTLLVLNLLALGAGTYAVARWLRRRGRSPWFAVLYGLWPGMVFAVFRDLSEPVAFALAAFAVLVWEARSNRRVAASAVLLAASMLTRETTIVFALAGAVVLAVRDRRLSRALLFLGGSIAPMVAWRIVVTQWLHATTFDHTGGWKVLLPFYAMRSYWPWDAGHRLILWTVDVPFVLLGLGALWLLYRRGALGGLVLFLLNGLAFVVFLPHVVEIDYGAAGRNAAPVLLGALYCVPLVRSRAVLLTAAALLSPLWYLLVAWALGLDGLGLATL